MSTKQKGLAIVVATDEYTPYWVLDYSTPQAVRGALNTLWDAYKHWFDDYVEVVLPVGELPEGLSPDTDISSLPKWQQEGAKKALMAYNYTNTTFDFERKVNKLYHDAENGDYNAISLLLTEILPEIAGDEVTIEVAYVETYLPEE